MTAATKTPAGLWVTVAVSALFVSIMGYDCISDRSERRGRQEAEEKEEKRQLDEKCTDARVLFFKRCMLVDELGRRAEGGTSREYCEALWGQTQYRHWDDDPFKPWARQIDCSEKTE